jgi:hypothetical protein
MLDVSHPLKRKKAAPAGGAKKVGLHASGRASSMGRFIGRFGRLIGWTD